MSAVVIRGLTGLIMRSGMPYGVAVVMKYVLLSGVVTGALLIMKAGYDKDRRQEGYDLCQAEARQAAEDASEAAEDVAEARDTVVREDKAVQRGEDVVTRERYNELRRDKNNDRITFERLLADAMARTNSDGSVNCANVPMPERLQRRVGN